MGFNSQCRDFEVKLINLINESQLPAAAVYFIFKSVYQDLENTYIGASNSEILSKQNDEEEQGQD